MPSSKATLAAHLAKGRAVKAEKQAQLSSESAFEDLWGSLQSANARIAELENELAQKVLNWLNCRHNWTSQLSSVLSLHLVLLSGNQSMRLHIMSSECNAKPQTVVR